MTEPFDEAALGEATMTQSTTPATRATSEECNFSASGRTMDREEVSSRFRIETTSPIIVESSTRVVPERSGRITEDVQLSRESHGEEDHGVEEADHVWPRSTTETTRDNVAGQGAPDLTTPPSSTSPSQGSDTMQQHLDQDDDELIEVVEPTWKAVPLQPRKLNRFEREESRRRHMTNEEWLMREKRRRRTTLVLIVGVVGTVVIGTVIICAIFVAQMRRREG
ncbi:BQ2448_7181 [Microbotryum intermedium]|uniref:BQ2448_7181 protein n=1 Tax=Microbotryum intermedium TaxID=269621 RepID=A0A238FQ84_9BASI|nr:BQ2448_7181 [Microbotryum intermedium]